VAGVERRPSGSFPAYRVLGEGEADLCPLLYEVARDEGWSLRELRRDVLTLEAVFNGLARSG
jgi:hypothetical protein